MSLPSYLRLMRLHQPAGIWLLLWPCWWAVALASRDMPSLSLLLLFGAGAVVMRGAGCIVNDIIDRDFDRQVQRTRLRPLASGEITLPQAVVFLLALLCIALFIALQMNRQVFILAACSLPLVAAYPFMKRITWWPQLFLGLTFNWGAWMGWVAVTGALSWPPLALYLGGVFWTLGYDTIYAHQDKADDMHIGVKSTALRLGAGSKRWIGIFYLCALLSWAVVGLLHHSGVWYFLGLAATTLHFIWQVRRVDLDNSASCLHTFRSNTQVGWIMFAAMMVNSFLAGFNQG